MKRTGAQLRLTLCDPTGYSPPGSSVHGIFRARTLEWVAISSSRHVARRGSQRCMLGCISHNHHIELFSTGARVSLRQGRKLQSMTNCLLLSLGKEGERAEVPLVISPEFGNWEFQVVWTAYWKGDPENIFGLFVCLFWFSLLPKKSVKIMNVLLGKWKVLCLPLRKKVD